MIIDSHLHLWVNDPQKYPWNPIGGYIPEGDAPLSRYLAVMDANGVDGAVLVQPTPYGWDNAYVLVCKATDLQKFKAVVLVDPLSEQAVSSLQSLVRQGADGLRINLQLQPVNSWKSEPFFRLWEACAAMHLPVCLQANPDYLVLIGDLAERFHTSIVIDHLGRPESGSDVTSAGFVKLLDLSEKQNIFVKLSGMNYYSAESAPYRDTWELLRAVRVHFGAERCLWGSDFPFVEDHWSFANLLDLLRHHLGFSDSDLDWVMGKTALSLWWDEQPG